MEKGWRKAAVKDGLISFAFTLVICLVINWFIAKPETGSELGITLVFAVGITALLLFVLNVFMKRATAKKGAEHGMLPDNSQQASYVFVPNNRAGFVFIYFLAAIFFIGFACAGVFSVLFADYEFPRVAIMIISSSVTALGAFYAAYHSSVFLVSYYQKLINTKSAAAEKN